jgi:hypothetical protein
MKEQHKRMLMIGAGVLGVCLVIAMASSMLRTKAPPVAEQTAQPTPMPPSPMFLQPPVPPAPPPPVASEPDALEQTFADVASTVLSRAGVDDRINPTMSTKNGGMLPILDVRGDYEPLMPFEDARCDENGRWNQSSRQQSIRIGLIRDQMKRRVVVQ